MAMANTDSNGTNPWIGLRTYSEGEIIYGRNEEIVVLTQQVLQNTQTVVCGKSGIGKSSILRAGVFPLVRNKGFFPVRIRLNHNSEDSYLYQIKNEINKAIAKSDGEIIAKELVKQPEDEELWDFFHRFEYRDKDDKELKPLIVLDQFEEIFTIEKKQNKVNNFFTELTALINNDMPEKHFAVNPEDEKNAEQEDVWITSSNSDCYSYNRASNFHIIITLRDDFLFYLEKYTPKIPALKNNRFCLMPITKEQAEQIITQPCPGLIDNDVARLIIEKINGRSETEIDNNKPVDSAILSLYLSRLFDKMTELGQDSIKENLVNTYGENILDEFYIDSTENLSEKSKIWIEENLVNIDGRRDNIDISKAKEYGGMSDNDIDALLNKSRLLTYFTYRGVRRIELMHDVLCEVVVRHRKERLEKNQILAIEQKVKSEKKKFRIRTSLVAVTIIGIVIAIAAWFVKDNKQVKVVDQQQNLVLSLEETNKVKDTDFWRAMLTVTGIYESGRDTLLLTKSIDKSDLYDSYTIDTDSCINLSFSLDFGDFAELGKYINTITILPVADIMKSPSIKLTIDRDIPELISFDGDIVLDAEGHSIPVENAFIMLGDVVSVSDSAGHFNMFLEELPDDDASLTIAKNNLGNFEIPISSKSENDGKFLYYLSPADSLRRFNKLALEMDSIDNWNYSTVGSVFCANKGSSNGLFVRFKDGHGDRLKMYWKNGETVNDKTMLTGFFFFNSDKIKLDNIGVGKFAYYIGNGFIDSKYKKDENNVGYRNFEFKGYDAAGNVRTVTGRYYKVRGVGKYTGDISSVKRQIATFGQPE